MMIKQIIGSSSSNILDFLEYVLKVQSGVQGVVLKPTPWRTHRFSKLRTLGPNSGSSYHEGKAFYISELVPKSSFNSHEGKATSEPGLMLSLDKHARTELENVGIIPWQIFP